MFHHSIGYIISFAYVSSLRAVMYSNSLVTSIISRNVNVLQLFAIVNVVFFLATVYYYYDYIMFKLFHGMTCM